MQIAGRLFPGTRCTTSFSPRRLLKNVVVLHRSRVVSCSLLHASGAGESSGRLVRGSAWCSLRALFLCRICASSSRVGVETRDLQATALGHGRRCHAGQPEAGSTLRACVGRRVRHCLCSRREHQATAVDYQATGRADLSRTRSVVVWSKKGTRTVQWEPRDGLWNIPATVEFLRLVQYPSGSKHCEMVRRNNGWCTEALDGAIAWPLWCDRASTVKR